MLNFGLWILFVTALLACRPIFSFKVESARDDVVMLKFPFNAITERFSNYHTNLRRTSSQFLSVQQNIKSTTEVSNPSHDSHSTSTSWRTHPTKSASKFGGFSRRWDDHKLSKDKSLSPIGFRSFYKTPSYKYFTDGSETTSPGFYELRSFDDKAYIGGFCRMTAQCPARSYCGDNRCICMKGYIRRGNVCLLDTPFSDPPNFLLALIAGVVFLIVVSCLFVIIMALRRKLRQARRNALPDDAPSISAVIDARRPVSPDPAYQRIDKPPSYDEAMSSSTTLLTLCIQDISSEPPSYVEVQQERRNRELRNVS